MSTETTRDDSQEPGRPGGAERDADDTQEPGRPGGAERDADELMRQLRAAPAEQIVVELFSTLLSTAQVKLGRRDARLFIDLCAQTLDYAGPHLPDDLVKEVEAALGQLRLAQVSSQSKVAASGEPEPNDLSRIPTPPTARGPVQPDSVDRPAPPTSTLWVPGR